MGIETIKMAALTVKSKLRLFLCAALTSFEPTLRTPQLPDVPHPDWPLLTPLGIEPTSGTSKGWEIPLYHILDSNSNRSMQMIWNFSLARCFKISAFHLTRS